MRTTFNVYRTLGKYVEAQDAAAQKRGLPDDPDIDAHFRSGVYLGVGMSNIILSLLPARINSIIELFGYRGDRKLGLELLMKAGGWTKDSKEPTVSRGTCPVLCLVLWAYSNRLQRMRVSDAVSAIWRS